MKISKILILLPKIFKLQCLIWILADNFENWIENQAGISVEQHIDDKIVNQIWDLFLLESKNSDSYIILLTEIVQ